MRLKGIYKDKSNYFKFSVLCLLIFISFIVYNLVASGLLSFFHKEAFSLIKHQDLGNPITVNYLKIMQCLASISIFIIPTYLYSYLTKFNFNLLSPNRQDSILAITIMILISPFINLLLEWNMLIPFPEWVMNFDINSDDIIKAFLKMSNLWGLILNIIILAIIPAIGEELLFRGYLQQKIGCLFGKMYISILITSFLFSIIHMDIHGLIPRFFLGIILGLLFFWSKSLWIPIIAHFTNNAQAILVSYQDFNLINTENDVFYGINTDEKTALFSLLSVCLLLYVFYEKNKKIKYS